MQHDSVPSKWDSPPGSPRPKRSIHEETTGRGLQSRDKSCVSLQNISPSVPRLSVPDGLDHVRYRPPDTDSFVFDVTTGYRFDPSTGLHYDANSGFFINYSLDVLLRWDPESSTYLRSGDFSGLGKPMTIPCAVQKVTASVLLGAEPTSNEKKRSVVDSHVSKERSRDGSSSDVERCKPSRTLLAMPSHPRTRRTDKSASRSKSNSPARRREDAGRVHVGRSRHRSPRSTEQSQDRTRVRSISRGRHLSRTNLRKTRSSRSREPRRSHSRGSRRSTFRESRLSPSRRARRSRSRLVRRSRGRVTRYSRSRNRRSRSRELSKSTGSTIHVNTEPRNRSGSHRKNNSSDRMQHDRSRSRGTKRLSVAPNLQDLSPKRKKLGTRDDSHSDSQPEDRTPVDVGGMERRRSRTTSTNSLDTTSSSHDSTKRDYEQVPDENEGPVSRDESREETPEFIVIDEYDISDSDARREKNPEVAVIDHGDVLGHLFTDDSETVTNILLIAPVPLDRSKSESDAQRNQVGNPEGLLEVCFNHKSTSGSPCHFMILSFKSAFAAKQFYDSQSGTIVLCGKRSKFKGYLHFLKKGNWHCKYCKSFNFFMQFICPKCYRAKDGGFSPISISEKPTKLVGIAKLKGKLSTVESVTESLPPLHAFNILSTKVMREPNGLSLGLCVFEVESREEGTKLHEFFLQQERLAVYVTINETRKPPDEIYLDRHFEKPAHHESIKLDKEQVPDKNEGPVQREESLEETPEFIAIDSCDISDGDQREESLGVTIIDCVDVSDSNSESQLECETRQDIRGMKKTPLCCTSSTSRQDTPSEAHQITKLDDEPGGPERREKSPDETSEFIVVEISDVDEPRVESPEVTVIDHGDVLGHLFTSDSQRLTNIVLIAPVPLQNCSKSESDELRNQIGNPEGLHKVYVNHESKSGSPCHFMVISFKSANAAKQWYDSQKGTIILCGGRSKLKGYLHFLKKGNWNCKHCKSFNFFMQSICPKCYRAKDGGFSPISISEEPSKLVGIAKLEGNFSTVKSVTESLPPLHGFNILSTKVMREPNGLSLGLCVFEVKSREEGTKLHKFFLQQERLAVYVTIREKPKTPDEIYLDCLFDKASPTNILNVALIPLLNISDMKLELSLMEIYLLMLLKEDRATYNKLTTHVDENVGAPYSYALITFDDAEAAAEWLGSRRNTFNNLTTSNQRSKVSLHFSEDNWECQGCHTLNFSLRSLCHRCFKHKERNRLGPISESPTVTRCVAISRFSNWSKADEDIVAHFREVLREFVFKGTEVIRDSKCPSLPVACVFEMHDKVESVRLKEYLTKEGRFSVFVVMHKELNERCSDDPSCAPDVIIVDEPLPECVDLTEDDDVTQTTVEPEFTRALNPRTPFVKQKLPGLMDQPTCALNPRTPFVKQKCPGLMEHPMLTMPSDNLCNPIQPSPLRIGNELPLQRSGCPIWASGQNTQNTILINQPRLMPPTDEQPSPLLLSYTVPFKHPGDVITVSPVPYPGQDARQFYRQLFLNDGAECESVDFCSENSFGVSYNYCLVKFRSSHSASEWFSKKQGVMEISYQKFPGMKVDHFKPINAYFHFLGGNWLCNCGVENSPSRSICFRCFTQNGEDVPPLENSSTPTKYLGVKLFKWYSADELALAFPTPRCTLYELEKIMYISDPLIRRDHFGFYVFETKTLDAATCLRDYCKVSPVVKSTGFVLLRDPTAGAIIELDFTFKPVVSLRIVNSDHDLDLISGNMIEKPFIVGKSQKIVCPDYEAFLWTSVYEYYLNNPPTNIVMISLCPGNREFPFEARAQIHTSLKQAGVNYKRILYCFKEDVGSPFSYCLVAFDSQTSAQVWFDKCNGTFQFTVPPPDDKKIHLNFENCFSQKSTSRSKSSYFINSKLHYSLPNWLCNCGSSNFYLRSVCHNCFENRSRKGAYVSCPHPTIFLGVRLTKYFPNLDASQLYGARKYGYNICDVKICLDRSLPRDPSGIIIFQVKYVAEAIQLCTFFTNLTRKQSKDPLFRQLMQVIDSSDTFIYTYLRCQPFIDIGCQPLFDSLWKPHQSENWDRYFSNNIPTNIIAIYHHILEGTPPVFNIPIERFGGKIQKFKNGGGFTATFWLIVFPSLEPAKEWYAANCGMLRRQNNQLTLYFTQGIWTCGQCSSPNFPARVLCYKCYEHKMGGYSPMNSSASPSRWVGITLQCDQKIAFASLENVCFKFRSVRIIIDPIVRLDGPSVLVFEMSSPAEGMELREFFSRKKLPSEFFVVHESSESNIPIYSEHSLSEISETITPDTENKNSENPTAAPAFHNIDISGLVDIVNEEHGRPSTSQGASAKLSGPTGTSSDTHAAQGVSFIESEEASSEYGSSLFTISDDETEGATTHQSISSSATLEKVESCLAPCHSQIARTDEFRSFSFASVFQNIQLCVEKTEIARSPNQSQVATSGKFNSARFSVLFENNETVKPKQSQITSAEEFGSNSDDHSNPADSQMTQSENFKSLSFASLFGGKKTENPLIPNQLEINPTGEFGCISDDPCDPAHSRVTQSEKFRSLSVASLFGDKKTESPVNPNQSEITSAGELGSSSDNHCNPAQSQKTHSEKFKSFSFAALFEDKQMDPVIPNQSQIDSNVEFSSRISVADGDYKVDAPADPVNSDSHHNIISVCPVPWPGRNAEQFYSELLSHDASNCLSIKYCQGDALGVSYNYCLVYFGSLESATEWHKMRQGRIKIINHAFPNIEVERFKTTSAFLRFSENNWHCKCGKENSPMRLVCFRCYKPRYKDACPFESSFIPTKWLGVKLDKWYARADLVTILSKYTSRSCNATKIRFISDPRIRKDNFGIYILETTTPKDAVIVRSYCNGSPFVRSSCFVVLKDPSAGKTIDLEVPARPVVFPRKVETPSTSDLVENSPGDSCKRLVCPDYDSIVWTSLYKFCLDNPPTNVVMISVCPGGRELPDEAKTQILNSLQEASVTHESIIYRFKGDVGSPFTYCLISFHSVDSAKMWVDKCDGCFQFDVPCPENEATPLNFQNCYLQKTSSKEGLSYFIKSKLHYSSPDWLCSCGTPNIFLRSLCHNCYKNKNGESDYESISKPVGNISDGVVWWGSTKFVGVKLNKYYAKLDTSSFKKVRKLGYDVSKINVCLDPKVPRDPYGIIIFELGSHIEAIKLHQFLSDSTNREQLSILYSSSGIVFLKCRESLKSTCGSPENLNCLFKNQTPTNTIIFHHPTSQSPECDIPLNSYGGRITKCKEFAGLLATFWLVYFPNKEDAKKWYDANDGKLKNKNTEFPQPTLYFLEDLWTCQYCHVENFPMRVLCYGCYEYYENRLVSHVKRSYSPTRWVGITETVDQQFAVEFLTRKPISFPLRSIQILTDPNVRQDGKFVLVFEVSSTSLSLELCRFFARKKRKTLFFTVREDSESKVDIDGSLQSSKSCETPTRHCGSEREDFGEKADVRELHLAKDNIESADPTMDISCESPLCESGSEGGYEPMDECTEEIILSSNVAASVRKHESDHVTKDESSIAQGLRAHGMFSSRSFAYLGGNNTKVSMFTDQSQNAPVERFSRAFLALFGDIQEEVPAPTNISGDSRSSGTHTISNDYLLRNAISVCPVPWPGTNAQQFYNELFSSDGAECDSVKYCHGANFGASFNYCLVYFTSLESATKWHSKRQGRMKILHQDFPNVKVERFKPTNSFLRFTGDNWRCNCGVENCPTRSVCFKCYKHKGKDLAPFEFSHTPTNWLAVKLNKWYAASDVVSMFLKLGGISVKNISVIRHPRKPKDQFGMYIFETTCLETSKAFNEYYKHSPIVQSIKFVILKDPVAITEPVLPISRDNNSLKLPDTRGFVPDTLDAGSGCSSKTKTLMKHSSPLLVEDSDNAYIAAAMKS